jgi:uncharacterized protein (DUF885 family)
MPTPDDLAARLWDAQMAAAPLWASALGDHRFADALPALDATSEAAHVDALRAMATEAASIDGEGLDEDARVTLATIREEAVAAADHLATRPLEIEVAPALVGPQNALYESCQSLTLPDATAAEGLVTRYRALDGWFAAATQRLAEGRAVDRTPVARAVAAAIRQIDGLLARPVEEDGLLAPAPSPDLDAQAAADWSARLAAAVTEVVRPALAAYRDDLAAAVAPSARPDDRCGLRWLPDGEADYAAAIRRFTSLELDPDELHAIGREEVVSLAEEYRSLGATALGTDDVPTIFDRLREDPELRFDTAEAVRGAAEAALDRARAAVPAWFGRLPVTPCIVAPLPAHEAVDGTLALYYPPAEDGSRPGTYMINTHAPQTRTRFEAEALAFHESIPGHHLQIAIAQELDHLPPLRRHLLVNAYVEGWALYTERLADEMGLYSSDVARLGMLSFDSWRACRLVVDTGLHHLGWSRQQAIDYLLANSPQAANNIANEVDRYIVWPGQALGYKVGQRAILALRARAEAVLGDAFAVDEFHDTVLGHGALPLGVLDDVVERWLCAR